MDPPDVVGAGGVRDDRERTLQTQGLSGFMSGSAAAVYRNVPHSVLVYSLYPHAANLTKKVSGGREGGFYDAVLRGLHHDGRRDARDAST